MSGLDSTGFSAKTQAEFQSDINDDIHDNLGSSINTSATAVIGIIVGILSEALAEESEKQQIIYNYLNPDNADGTALDNLCSLTGVTRLAATYATGTLICTGTATTSLTSGRQVSLNGYTWTTDANATDIWFFFSPDNGTTWYVTIPAKNLT